MLKSRSHLRASLKQVSFYKMKSSKKRRTRSSKISSKSMSRTYLISLRARSTRMRTLMTMDSLVSRRRPRSH
jgi:hypothetical protein